MGDPWLLQANPAKFFIVHYFLNDYLKANKDFEDDWQVEERYVSKFKVGDMVYIWKAKGQPRRDDAPEYWQWQKEKRGGPWPAGIYAIGEVVEGSGIIQYTTSEMEPFKKYYVGDTWKQVLKPIWRVKFKYIYNLVDRPLEEGQVWQMQGLSPNFRGFQNFRQRISVLLEAGDRAILQRLIFGSVVPGPDPPEWVRGLVERVRKLRADSGHVERAHESLVEDFLELLGYDKDSDIEWRKGYMDLSLKGKEGVLAVVEVKNDWSLAEGTKSFNDAFDQAYRYAHKQGVRYVIVTNGDYYAVYDRQRGLSYYQHRLGHFHLTRLAKEALALVDILKKGRLGAS